MKKKFNRLSVERYRRLNMALLWNEIWVRSFFIKKRLKLNGLLFFAGPHDPVSLIKCCESLAFLVRDVAHITPYNFDICVHCIRTFVEASLQESKLLILFNYKC